MMAIECTYPIKYLELHAHTECLRPKVDVLRDVQQHLVVQGLHPKSVSALKVCYYVYTVQELHTKIRVDAHSFGSMTLRNDRWH